MRGPKIKWQRENGVVKCHLEKQMTKERFETLKKEAGDGEASSLHIRDDREISRIVNIKLLQWDDD